MNFYVAILILKMEENMQHFWHIMPYYFKKGKNANEMQRKICSVYGEGTVIDQMCQKWFVKFYARGFSLDDASWLGRPVEVHSDQKLLVKMKNVSFILWKKPYGFFGQPNR